MAYVGGSSQGTLKLLSYCWACLTLWGAQALQVLDFKEPGISGFGDTYSVKCRRATELLRMAP